MCVFVCRVFFSVLRTVCVVQWAQRRPLTSPSGSYTSLRDLAFFFFHAYPWSNPLYPRGRVVSRLTAYARNHKNVPPPLHPRDLAHEEFGRFMITEVHNK